MKTYTENVQAAYEEQLGRANRLAAEVERLREAADKWKRIAQDRCTCVARCGDTPEESGGVCKGLPNENGF